MENTLYTLIWKELDGFVVQLGTFTTREKAEQQIQADIPNHDLDLEVGDIEEFIEDTYIIIESDLNTAKETEIKRH
ncbi:hypothetical protein [Staphylococcus saprophyticus]|uniref:hypothetical protein n=1 Tax=Staphylococcus saprophyticus TaxID=29385 RepID=UPI0034C65723